MIIKILKHFFTIWSKHNDQVSNDSVKFSQLFIFFLWNLLSKTFLPIYQLNFEFHFGLPFLEGEFTLIFLEMMLKSVCEDGKDFLTDISCVVFSLWIFKVHCHGYKFARSACHFKYFVG